MNLKDVKYEDYTVVDLETTVNAPSHYAFKASPEYPHNYVVMAGKKIAGMPGEIFYGRIHDVDRFLHRVYRGNRLLVGHNIKFDLKYLLKETTVRPEGYFIWDTAIAEYMITGQKDKFASLNDVAAKYKLGTKVDGIKELWDMGVKTENMDPTMLGKYLVGDLDLTEQVFLEQIKLLDMAGAKKLKEHIVRCSTASWFYAFAELRGLMIDNEKLNEEIAKQQHIVREAQEKVYKAFEDIYGIPSELRDLYDPMTPTFLGKALFNEPITITQEEAHLRVLKNGQPAKRKRKIDIEYKPKQVAWMDSSLKEIGGNGQIKVPAELLATASMSLGDEHFSKAVLDYRSAEKLLNTYLDPIRDFRTKAESECVHPQFNLTSTNTGRTSCAKPNAQNLPPEVEKMITGGTYKIVKADFKQLQIVGLALVTKDAQLIDDLQNGRDIHYETGKTVFNWTDPNQMNKADRRVVKNTNFGLIFGGSAGGIARQTGVDKKTVAQCINAFYSRYPGVKEWHDKIKDEALEKATPIPEEFNECGDQVRETYLRTPLGRLLRFEERDAPAWLKARTKRSIAFSPNEIVCYPIQGYTDGDLVPAFIVECNDYVGNSWFIPINMVHDSLWLLTTDPERTKVELNKAVERLNTSLGLKVPLALDITVEG